MQFGANLPIIGEFADVALLTDLAREAEEAGWDGLFVWDTLLFSNTTMPPVIDPWITLASIAMATRRVTIGPMVAQLARRRPWDVARVVVALDHLSRGRFVLGVGLGYATDADFGDFGEPTDARVRADRLDEALDVIAGLCSGERFGYRGEHYQIKETVFRPVPLHGRIPVWVGGYWPRRRPMRRAARWDGAFPAEVEATDDGFVIKPMTVATVRDIREYIAEHRNRVGPFDFVISHELPLDDPDRAAAGAAEFAKAGVTWIVRDWLPWNSSPDEVRGQLRAGPLGRGRPE